MPTSSGPNQTAEENLVFAYDVGDVKNSYIGEPTENLVADALTMANWGNYSAGNDGTFITEFNTTGYKVRGKNTWNGILKGITLPTPGTYTISAWFRIWGKSSGNNGINVYTNGGGISDTAQGGDDTRIGEWQRISMTRTYTTTSITFFIISWGGTSGVDWSSWDVTKPQVELNSHATQFIEGPRSTTEGLIDLTGNSSIDLANVSFDSNAQMTFDGTNDYVNMGDLPIIKLGTNFTIEAVVKPEQDKWMYFFHKGYGQNNSLAWGRHSTGDNWFFATMINGSYQYSYMGTATLNQYCHLVASYDGANLRLYENGDLKATRATTHDMMTSTQPLGIGGPDRYWNGKIPVTKVYSRALTAQEVKQNYQQYKTRFNLS